MLKFSTSSKRKIQEDVDRDSDTESMITANTASENQDVFHPSKKYKDKFQTLWFGWCVLYKWLKYSSETDVMTCSFCNEFSRKFFKTST